VNSAKPKQWPEAKNRNPPHKHANIDFRTGRRSTVVRLCGDSDVNKDDPLTIPQGCGDSGRDATSGRGIACYRVWPRDGNSGTFRMPCHYYLLLPPLCVRRCKRVTVLSHTPSPDTPKQLQMSYKETPRAAKQTRSLG